MKSLDANDLSAAKKERESPVTGLREGRVAAKNDSTVASVFSDSQSSRRISKRTVRHAAAPARPAPLGDHRPARRRRDRDRRRDGGQDGRLLGVGGVVRRSIGSPVASSPTPFAEGWRRGTPATDSAARRCRRSATRRPSASDAAEVEKLIEAAATSRWKTGLGLMALAGLRLGEARAITWGDVSDLSVSVSKLGHPDRRDRDAEDGCGEPPRATLRPAPQAPRGVEAGVAPPPTATSSWNLEREARQRDVPSERHSRRR